MRNIRISIFMVVFSLICLGIVAVYSSSAVFSYERYQSSTFFLRHHLFHFLIGLFLTAFVMSLDLTLIRRWAKPFFAFSLLLLVLLYVPALGKEIGGARRWLKIGGFSFQPSELVKWATVLFLADGLAKINTSQAGTLRHFFNPLAALGLVCALIVLQPDLGSALGIGVVGVLIFFVAGMPCVYIAALFLTSLPVLYFSIFNVPYRRQRILAFLNPWADVQGYGFQIIQSYLALGLGGLWGVGLGQSRQKLFYLPAAHTDFIFSIIAEELGLLGSISILALFIIFLWQGIQIALRASSTFIQLLSFGIVATIVFSACVHIAVACGAIPTKGMPLPFISYGGTALIFNMMGVGLLLNCARDRYFHEQKL